MIHYENPIPNLYLKEDLYNTYLSMLLTNKVLHISRLFDYGFIVSDIGRIAYVPERLVGAPPELVQPAKMFKDTSIIDNIKAMSAEIKAEDNKATIKFLIIHKKDISKLSENLSDSFLKDIMKTLPGYNLKEARSENHTFLTFSQEFEMTRSERMFASNIEGYVRPKEQ